MSRTRRTPLATFASALLDGTAPGLAATITWHTGQTGGYTTYFGIDRADRTAVILLSDVSNPAISDLGRDLLADHA